jgi:hypothetical protein
VSALRIPLSARFPAPAEQLALHVMIVVQMAASALLFPHLFRSLAGAILTVGAGGAFLQLAAILAARADARAAWVVAYGVTWLAGLAVWAKVARTPKSQMYVTATLAFLTIGGGVIAYLVREFGAPAQDFDWAARGWLGPVVGALSLLEVGPSGQIWAFLGSFWIAAVLGWAWVSHRARRVG